MHLLLSPPYATNTPSSLFGLGMGMTFTNIFLRVGFVWLVSQNKKKHIQGTTSEHTAQRGEKEKNYFSKNCGPFFLVQFFHFFRKGCCCSLDKCRTPPSLPDFRITEIEQSLPTLYSVLSGGLIFPSLRKRTLFVVGFLSSISHIPYPISASTIATPISMCCIRKTSSSPFHFSQVFSVLSVFTQFSQFSNPISEMLQVPLFPLLPTCVSLRVPGPPPTSVVLVPEYIEYIEYIEYTAHFHVPMWNASNPGTSFLRSNQFPFFSWSLRAFLSW